MARTVLFSTLDAEARKQHEGSPSQWQQGSDIRLAEA